jgi:hypothetical protein
MDKDKSKENSLESGIIYVPYVIVTTATSINGEIVWYRNKWKNLLLKIKHFFVKPKYLRNNSWYTNSIDSSKYDTVNIKKT